MVDDWRRSFRAVGEEFKRLAFDSSTDTSRCDTDGDNADNNTEQEADEDTVLSPEATHFIELLEEDYQRIKIGDLPSEQYAKVRQDSGVDVLVIDTDNIPRDVLLSAADQFESIHEILNGFAIGNRGGVAEAAKTEGNDGMVDEIYSNYKDKLPYRLLPVLKDALVLRVTARKQHVKPSEMFEWRGEIAGDHKARGNDPKEAHNLISLCSAGYFDADRFFNKLYRTRVKHDSWDISRYKEVSDIYIRKNPFTIFVSPDNLSPTDVYDLTRRKARRLDTYPAPPGFVDICGRGPEPRELIEDSLREFLESNTVPDYQWIQPKESDQHILRIEAAPFQL